MRLIQETKVGEERRFNVGQEAGTPEGTNGVSRRGYKIVPAFVRINVHEHLLVGAEGEDLDLAAMILRKRRNKFGLEITCPSVKPEAGRSTW
jgi:hypothetical protein